MGRIQRPQEIKPQQLSLVSQRSVDLPPPSARPLAALSPLERAVVDHDLATVKSLLRDGADPQLVCPVRLHSAAASNANGAACARLIQVTSRMQRMNLAAPTSLANAVVATGSLRPADTRSGPINRLMHRFAIGSSHNKSAGSAGPITQALHDLDLATATRALEKTGAPPWKFVPGRHQDRLIGMLALNDTKKLDAWHRKGLLNPALQAADAPGLKNFVKQFSHRKLPPGRKKLLRLNGTVTREDTRQKIVCRHLATYWLLHRPLLENGKIDYASLSSKKSLKKAFEGENEYAHEYYMGNCTNSHLVRNDKWGNFLAMQFREMAHANHHAEPKRILICSDNHGMACELKIKEDVNGSPTYAVDFYDPNATASHRRVRTQDLEAIESLSMGKLINHRPTTNLYYKNQSLSMAFIIAEQTPRAVSADSHFKTGKCTTAKTGINTIETIANRQLSSRPVIHSLPPPTSGRVEKKAQDASPVDGNYVYQVVSHGFVGEFPHVFAEIAKMPDTSEQVEVLSKPSSRGVPPLVAVMALGYENTVSAYTSGVLALTTLSGDQKTKIFLKTMPIKRLKKMTGLQSALIFDNESVVGTFTRLVLASEALTPDQKCRILDTTVKGKNLIFYGPFGVITPASGKAFSKAVHESDVTPELRARLLGRS